MPGVAVDESSARLARALARSPADVEQVLLEVGVDAAYLSRALLEGDPQGALAAVSQRLGVTRRELAIAVLRAVGLGGSTPPARGRRRAARFVWSAATAAGIGALALAALVVSYFVAPALFLEAVLATVAVFAALSALALGALAWRLARIARRARLR